MAPYWNATLRAVEKGVWTDAQRISRDPLSLATISGTGRTCDGCFSLQQINSNQGAARIQHNSNRYCSEISYHRNRHTLCPYCKDARYHKDQRTFYRRCRDSGSCQELPAWLR